MATETKPIEQNQSSQSKIFWLVFDVLRFIIIIGILTIVLYLFAVVMNVDAYKISDVNTNTIYLVTPGESITIFLIKYVMPIVMVVIILVWAIIRLFWAITSIVSVEIKKINDEQDKAWVEYFKSGHTLADFSAQDKEVFNKRYFINTKYDMQGLAILLLYILSLVLLIAIPLSIFPTYIDMNALVSISLFFIITIPFYYYFKKYYTKSSNFENRIKYDQKIKERLIKKGLLDE